MKWFIAPRKLFQTLFPLRLFLEPWTIFSLPLNCLNTDSVSHLIDDENNCSEWRGDEATSEIKNNLKSRYRVMTTNFSEGAKSRNLLTSMFTENYFNFVASTLSGSCAAKKASVWMKISVRTSIWLREWKSIWIIVAQRPPPDNGNLFTSIPKLWMINDPYRNGTQRPNGIYRLWKLLINGEANDWQKWPSIVPLNNFGFHFLNDANFF